MTKIIAPILLTLVLTACGGGGGGGSTPTNAQNPGPTPPAAAALNIAVPHIAGNVKNMTVGDLNGDGLDDVVIGGWGGPGNSASIYVLIQNANGTLTDQTSTLLPVTSYSGSQHIFIKDFDGDGRNDIFIPGFNDGCAGSCSVHSIIFWNNGTQFTQQTLPESLDSHGACVDDINNDGRPDVLVRGVYDQNLHATQGGLYINNGNRSFTLNLNFSAGSTCSINHEANGNVSILTGNGNAISTYDSNLNLISSVAIASQDPTANDLIDSISLDVNADGAQDFVLIFDNPSDNTKGRREVWLNNGNGGYAYSYTIDQDNYSTYHHAVFTYNGTKTVYFSGANLQAKLYQIQNGQFVAYQQSRFQQMAQQAGYYPGFTWSVDSGTVYQNSSTGKLYMLQSINGTIYTQEL